MTMLFGRSPSIGTEAARVCLPSTRNAETMKERKSGPLQSLRAVVLLGGSVRPNSLANRLGRSVLDLPIAAGSSLGDYWRQQCAALFHAEHLNSTRIRLLLDRYSLEPSRSDDRVAPLEIETERDPVEYRGTGGVLHDCSGEYDDDDLLLVGSAGQMFRRPIAEIVRTMAGVNADVALISDTGGAPSGLMLVRCRCLRDIPAQGFVDLKEQALPLIARQFNVQVIERSGLVDPIRTCAEYIDALRGRYGMPIGGQCWRDSQDDGEGRRFGIIENGARVHPSASVHDSVILKDAQVEKGAVIIRSVVCGRVRSGQIVADELVPKTRGRI